MTRLRWPEILFIVCFLIFGVGGGWFWPSEGIVEATLALAGGTVVGIGVWLGVLYLIIGPKKTEPESEADPHR